MAETHGTCYEGDQEITTDNGNLPEGVIFVDGDLTLIDGPSIENPSNLAATIVCTGKIRCTGHSVLSAAQDHVVFIARDDVEIGGENSLEGVVYSEAGAISLKGTIKCEGALIAKDGISITGCPSVKRYLNSGD